MSKSAHSTASAAVYLVALQLTSRLVTFSLNQSLLRWTSPAVFGAASIQLEFLLNTILFLSREGMRGAILRQTLPSNRDKQRQLVRTTWMPLFAGLLFVLILPWVFVKVNTAEVSDLPFFNAALMLYSGSAIIELASEPFFSLLQLQAGFRTRVAIEGLAVIAKALCTLVVIRLLPSAGPLAFGLGQIVYSATILARYLFHYRADLSLFLPTNGPVATNVASLAFSLSGQSLLKQFLSEGDKAIIGRFTSIADQGGYAVALNYGSLVARCLFQPIEESARMFFSQSAQKLKAKEDGVEAQKSMGNVLETLLHAYSLLAIIVTCFGPPYVPFLIRLVLGTRWSNSTAPSLLALYCYLLPFLGYNGILEAFVQSTIEKRNIASMNRFLMLWSLVYLSACLFFCRLLEYGAEGFIYANMINMTCRIAYCYFYINTWLKDRHLTISIRALLPSRWVFVPSITSAYLSRFLPLAMGTKTLRKDFEHLALGISLFFVVLLAIFKNERAWFVNARTLFKSTKTS